MSGFNASRFPIVTDASSAPERNLSIGTQAVMVILVEFDDRSSVGTTAANWNSNFFGASGSVGDFYDEVSYSNLTLSPATESHGTANDGVVGWPEYEDPNEWYWEELYDQTGMSEDMSFMLFTDPCLPQCWLFDCFACGLFYSPIFSTFYNHHSFSVIFFGND